MSTPSENGDHRESSTRHDHSSRPFADHAGGAMCNEPAMPIIACQVGSPSELPPVLTPSQEELEFLNGEPPAIQISKRAIGGYAVAGNVTKMLAYVGSLFDSCPVRGKMIDIASGWAQKAAKIIEHAEVDYARELAISRSGPREVKHRFKKMVKLNALDWASNAAALVGSSALFVIGLVAEVASAEYWATSAGYQIPEGLTLLMAVPVVFPIFMLYKFRLMLTEGKPAEYAAVTSALCRYGLVFVVFVQLLFGWKFGLAQEVGADGGSSALEPPLFVVLMGEMLAGAILSTVALIFIAKAIDRFYDIKPVTVELIAKSAKRALRLGERLWEIIRFRDQMEKIPKRIASEREALLGACRGIYDDLRHQHLCQQQDKDESRREKREAADRQKQIDEEKRVLLDQIKKAMHEISERERKAQQEIQSSMRTYAAYQAEFEKLLDSGS